MPVVDHHLQMAELKPEMQILKDLLRTPCFAQLAQENKSPNKLITIFHVNAQGFHLHSFVEGLILDQDRGDSCWKRRSVRVPTTARVSPIDNR